ncbi:LysR substrate-binding domain-containing protein [Curvibacter fontanus]|jgi:aminoethylphosphonate catabolism LysR family transcriptional regulator|nr:LysR family transcriptional regulator [Roseomonas sp.]MDZ4074696.1 LysR substrate-binding domain-containing protein [Hylemonella sp.]
MSGLSLLAALKAFDATARWGSMTAAARFLELQQPTVSAHIQRLEQEYGVELLYRRGRRLELTAFGRALLDHTRRAFSAEEDAHALLAAARSRYAGRLVVHAIGPYNVVPIVKAYAQAYPQVSVVVGVGDSRTITAKIADYQGDVGVVLNHAEVPELHGMPYRTQRLVVFAHADHPLAQRGAIALQDLQGQRFVMREEGSTTRRVFEQELADRGVRIQAALEMGSREAVREAVAQGLGLGIVAETAYIPDPRLVKLQLRDSVMATRVYIICRSERRQSPLIAAFFDLAGQLGRDLD